MIIPKHRGLNVEATPDRLVLSWRQPRETRHVWPILFGGGGVLLIFPLFLPGPHPSAKEMMVMGGVLFGAAVFSIWWAKVSTYRIIATRTGVQRVFSPFSNLRTKTIPTPIKQFFLKASLNPRSGQPCACLHAILEDDVSQDLKCEFPDTTMARQVWADLQAFYDLEDIEVLGEMEHNVLGSHRAKIRKEMLGHE